MDGKALTKISELAERLHAGQTRNDGVTPYTNHTKEVSTDLARDGFNLHMQAAGMLHDVLEDQPVTVKDLFIKINDIVGIEDATIIIDLVIGMTSPDKFFEVKELFNRKNRKSMMRAHYSTVGWQVAVIKIYDRHSNIMDMRSFKDDFKRIYIQETADLLHVLEDVINDSYFEGKREAQAAIRRIHRKCLDIAVDIGVKNAIRKE